MWGQYFLKLQYNCSYLKHSFMYKIRILTVSQARVKNIDQKSLLTFCIITDIVFTILHICFPRLLIITLCTKLVILIGKLEHLFPVLWSVIRKPAGQSDYKFQEIYADLDNQDFFHVKKAKIDQFLNYNFLLHIRKNVFLSPSLFGFSIFYNFIWIQHI